MTLYRLEELFPNELAEHVTRQPVIVIPIGTLEWHSHHLPLGLDGIVARGICEQIAEGLDAVLAPTSYSAVDGVPYPYTLNHSISVIEPLYVSMFEQFGLMGFEVIVAFTGHFGLAQTLALKRAALSVMRRSRVTILPATEYDMTTDAGYQGDHAGVGETSLLWTLREDLVRLSAVQIDEPLDGVLGEDPRGKASPELGSKMMDIIVSRTVEVADRLLSHTDAVARQDYVEAVFAGVRVLEETQARRAAMPKSQVPSLSTSSWKAYLQHIYRGDYRSARNAAEEKLIDLES